MRLSTLARPSSRPCQASEVRAPSSHAPSHITRRLSRVTFGLVPIRPVEDAALGDDGGNAGCKLVSTGWNHLALVVARDPRYHCLHVEH